MKKINVLLLAFIALFMFSCDNSDTPVKEDDVVVEEEVVVEETAPEVTTSTVEIPNFESEELTGFTEEFSAYFDKSMVLLKSGDMEGLASLEEEGKALQEKGESLKNSVSEEDKALLEEYLKGKAKEMLSASGLDQLGEKMEEEMNN